MSRYISTQLIAFLVGNVSLTDFNQWIRQTPELRYVLTPTDYNTLMTTNLQQAEALPLLDRILRGYIDWAQYEKEQLSELLMAIIWKDDAITALVRAYEQYRQGFTFLSVLGVDCGLALLTATNSMPNAARQEEILATIYPKACNEAKRLLTCLVAGKITFTGEYTPNGRAIFTEY